MLILHAQNIIICCSFFPHLTAIKKDSIWKINSVSKQKPLNLDLDAASNEIDMKLSCVMAQAYTICQNQYKINIRYENLWIKFENEMHANTIDSN